MKYRNNLTNHSNNAYFQVTSPFKIHIAVGRYGSNTFFGASQAMGILYHHISLDVGDEIHDLSGGTFVYRKGKTYPAKMKLSEKHPFEKVYGVEEEIFPLDKLNQINATECKDWQTNLPDVPSPKSYYGRGIDSVEVIP